MHSNPHMFMERKDFIKQFLILAGVKNSLFSLNLSKWSQITNLKIYKYISRQNLKARVPKYLIRLSALSSNPLLVPSHLMSPSTASLMACFPEKGRQSSEEFQSRDTWLSSLATVPIYQPKGNIGSSPPTYSGPSSNSSPLLFSLSLSLLGTTSRCTIIYQWPPPIFEKQAAWLLILSL